MRHGLRMLRYASLINITDKTRQDGLPTFVAVDLKTNRSTVVSKGGPYILGLVL